MKRRNFIKGILALASIPLVARAKTKTDDTIGYYEGENVVRFGRKDNPKFIELSMNTNKGYLQSQKMFWNLKNGSTINFVDATKDYWKL